MAVRPGEENVATLFGDIHYFYGPQSANPPHHRFDKGSYVYLFENANDRRARIEIANHPGTDDQDAFTGFLDKTQVKYSYKQQCLVSIVIDDGSGNPTNLEEWHLPTYDPRNENKYHYRLASLDIYFWTQTDALQFVNGVRRVLPPAQVEVSDEPGPPSRAPPFSSVSPERINPLVQKLENVAISDPKYSTPRPAGQNVPSFAPPPVASSASETTVSPASFVPMAYNPAAPAAPESVRHREKTPPPDDGGIDPLRAAAARDQAMPPTPGFPSGIASPGLPPHGLTSPGFPPQGLTSPGLPPHGLTSPGFPPNQYGHLQRSQTMPAAGMASPGVSSPYGAQYHGVPSFAAPPPPPNTQMAPTPPPGVSAPPGGYSGYSYTNPGSTAMGGDEYAIHQQVYRPTEGEHAVKYKPNHGKGKIEENAARLERGVSGMLKKFEKKFA